MFSRRTTLFSWRTNHYFSYLCNCKMPVMKQLFVFLTAAAILCCAQPEQIQDTADDSRYQWEGIRHYLLEEPEHALAMVDTAQMRGVADVNYANWMRAQVYLAGGSKEDLAKAQEYCLVVLDNHDPVADSLQRVKTYHLLVDINQRDPKTYDDAIHYALDGARISHENGWNGEEAQFYFDAGETMEKVQRGSGTEYLDRSLDMFRGSTNIKALPMFSYYLGSVTRMAVNNEDYARAVALTQEREQVIDRIEKEYTTAPAGYIDQQRAYVYSLLAYCQYQLGDKAAADRSAQAFEKTKCSQLPEHQHDIFNYYVISGNARRIDQIFAILEPYYREREDTVSTNYAILLQSYSIGLDKLGRSHEAYGQLTRYTVLTDSLTQRERRGETLMWAQQMRTQEKEMKIKEQEAEARLHWIIIAGLVLLLTVVGVALWRILLAHQRLKEKNRQLYETVQQMLQQQEKEQEKAMSAPESASQQLYGRLCQLMREQQPYTDSELNRDTVAQMLGTNYNAVAAAIREFADGATLGEFLDDWRIRHAAALLRDSNDPVGLVGEMSGFASRSHFNTLFREKFKLSPTEYRKAARG